MSVTCPGAAPRCSASPGEEWPGRVEPMEEAAISPEQQDILDALARSKVTH